MVDYDLTFVAPHRREEVVRRIRVVEQFIVKPGRAAAERGAAELGIGITLFYALARIWRETRSPAQMIGASRPRQRHSRLAAEQQVKIEAAIRELPDGSVQAIAVRAIELGKAAGVTMPALNSIRKAVELRRAGTLSSASPAAGADVVVTTCAIDLPILSDDSMPSMPLLTAVIEIGPPPTVRGLVLSVAGDQPAIARALLDALRGWRSRSGHTPKLAFGPPADGNATLLEALAAAGLTVRTMPQTPQSVMHDAVALLGRKPAGFRLLPSLTTRSPAQRIPTLAAGASPLPLNEAEQLLRSRLASGSGIERFGLSRGRPALERRLLTLARGHP